MNQLQFLQEIPEDAHQIVIPVTTNHHLLQQFPAWQKLALDFDPSKGELLELYQEGKKYYLVGVGEKPTFQSVLEVFKKLSITKRGKFSETLTVQLASLESLPNSNELVDAAVNGLIVGAYDIRLYQTDQETLSPCKKLQLVGKATEAQKTAAQKGRQTAEVQQRMMDLVNAPANYLQPKHLAEWIQESGKKFGYQVKVYEKEEIEALGMHSYLSVNKGSTTEPKLIVAEYKPEKASGSLTKIALVGKGVTYDTGGLSIKTAGMHYMKSDMGGAAMMLGTLELVARLQLPVHIHLVVAATENDVDANSTKPGDVVGSYLGKTIEIIDTDAEGRLTLADALTYAIDEFSPDLVLDAATLTGNSVLALGNGVGALFATDQALAEKLTQLGEATGEHVWQLPLWEFYADEMKSDVADIKNYHGKPYAGAITAAKFLQFFTREHKKWVHIDMAGAAFGNTSFGKDKNATGYGARLLMEFLSDLN